MLISINNKNDVHHYRLYDLQHGAYEMTVPEPINFDYKINLTLVGTIKFFDDLNNDGYSLSDKQLKEFRRSIHFGLGESFEVLVFGEAATGEYHRIKREVEETFKSAAINYDNSNIQGD